MNKNDIYQLKMTFNIRIPLMYGNRLQRVTVRGEQKYRNTGTESVLTDTDRIQSVWYSVPHIPKIRYSIRQVSVLFGILYATEPTDAFRCGTQYQQNGS